ncbi:MlaA family lipoprotein, partial [Sphingomonas aurantiaca]|uniref:MlaA family lipoprotein n=1 Tax=Sphingomonas aurantiaca TaxID=185949 RepID=UPI00125F463E
MASTSALLLAGASPLGASPVAYESARGGVPESFTVRHSCEDRGPSSATITPVMDPCLRRNDGIDAFAGEQNADAAPAQTLAAPQPLPQQAPLAPASATDPVPVPVPVPDPVPVQEPTANDILVTARGRVREDPLQEVNLQSFAINQAVDQAVVGPAARAYAGVVPEPLRNGLRNFLYNLHEPVIALNFLLQLKPGKAAETLGRLGVNSTIGGAGLFDVAKRRRFNLPRRRNGFANTLGFYGVKPGAFLFLPFVGPTTLRDLIGGAIDGFIVPTAVGKPFNNRIYTLTTGINRGLDRRAQNDERIDAIRKAADPYGTARTRYLLAR